MHLRLRGKPLPGLPGTIVFPYKLFLLMRLTAFLVLVFSFHATARTSGQQVTLHVKEASLRQVFRQIKEQTGYSFVFTSQMLERSNPVALSVKDEPLQSVLEKLFSQQPLQFSLVDKAVVVRYKVELPEINYLPPPPIDVEGIVVDEKDNEPLIGAAITVKGTEKGIYTDKLGRFTLRNLPSNAVLIVSFVGYQTRELKPAKGGTFTVTLSATSSSMKEMVVTGVMNRPKETFTGASSSFTNEDLKKVSGINMLTALSALDPSFRKLENINLGSNPNALPNVVLRSGNSMEELTETPKTNLFSYNNSPNTPLFILDGFEVNLQRVNDLDLNRVAKVDILKDAAATSIYGSRAANGVIVIETIRPKSGKLRVSYNLNLVTELPDLSSYDLLNASEKLDLENKLGYYSNTFNNASHLQLQALYNARLAQIYRGVNTDWMAQPLRSTLAQRHNLYVEGGAGDIIYGVSASYNTQPGVMKGSARNTNGVGSYLSYRVKNLQIRNDLNLSFNRAFNSPYGNFADYSRMNPYLTPFDSAGNMKFYLEDITAGSFVRALNPLYNAGLNTVDKSAYTNISNNFSIIWQAARWLRINSRISAMRQNDDNDRFLPAQHTSFANTTTFEKGSYTRSYGRSSSLDAAFSADINYRMNKHLLFGTINTNIRNMGFSTETVTVVGFPNPRLDQFLLGYRYPVNSKPAGSESINRMMGLLANTGYSYDNRYMLDLSYRLDGSSQFGANRRVAPFWSAGLGWNIHKEKFLSNARYLNRLKLRYSYGVTGSQNFESFLGLSTSAYYNDKEYRGVISTYLLGYGNPNLEWQTTYKTNYGVDITLFNRLDISANYYVEKTKGSIASITIPPSVGFSSYTENLGDLLGKGWELSTRFNIIASAAKRDNWSVFANLFSSTSVIQRVSNTIKAINQANVKTASSKPRTLYAEGQSTSAIWAVPSLGIDPSNGLEIYRTREGKLTNIYNSEDQIIVGDTRSKVEGTFGTSFEIKGVGLNMFLRFRYGGQAYNQTLVDRVENVDIANNNVDRRVAEERWMKPGDNVFFKGAVNQAGLAGKSTSATSRFVQDNNYISGESISLYYRLPDHWNKKLKLSNTRLSFYTADLFYFSSIKRERGLSYPFSRSYTLQLQTSL